MNLDCQGLTGQQFPVHDTPPSKNTRFRPWQGGRIGALRGITVRLYDNVSWEFPQKAFGARCLGWVETGGANLFPSAEATLGPAASKDYPATRPSPCAHSSLP